MDTGPFAQPGAFVIIAVMLRRLAGPLFVLAGALHFVVADTYVKIMPAYLPAQRELVYASGVAEIAGGAGLMHPGTRRFARWWLTATLIAVFPANLNMALHADRYGADTRGGRAALLARLPLQLVLIAWVRAAADRPEPLRAPDRRRGLPTGARQHRNGGSLPR